MTDRETIRLRVKPELPVVAEVELPVPWGDADLREAMRSMTDDEKVQMVDDALESDHFEPWWWEEIGG